MPSEQWFELVPVGAGCELELGVERVQPEDVVMRAVARWRAGAAITDRAEAVAPLQRGDFSLAQPACLRRQAPGEPVRERAAGRVGIVDDEREPPRSVRRARPFERRRDIIAVAGVLNRNRARLRERRAREREALVGGHGSTLPRAHGAETGSAV